MDAPVGGRSMPQIVVWLPAVPPPRPGSLLECLCTHRDDWVAHGLPAHHRAFLDDAVVTATHATPAGALQVFADSVAMTHVVGPGLALVLDAGLPGQGRHVGVQACMAVLGRRRARAACMPGPEEVAVVAKWVTRQAAKKWSGHRTAWVVAVLRAAVRPM